MGSFQCYSLRTRSELIKGLLTFNIVLFNIIAYLDSRRLVQELRGRSTLNQQVPV